MNENATEAAIQAAGKTAPRVTPADVDAAISAEFYFTADEGALGAYRTHNDVYQCVRHDDNVAQIPLSLLTFCVLVLRNGFTVTGESACASPENFDAEIGRKIAYDNARAKVWPLLGYALRDKLAGTSGAALVVEHEAEGDEAHDNLSLTDMVLLLKPGYRARRSDWATCIFVMWDKSEERLELHPGATPFIPDRTDCKANNWQIMRKG